tara:strand:- start:2738 stop:3508 length:771 start_codon:yes stop_codon:yes gene_type:complete
MIKKLVNTNYKTTNVVVNISVQKPTKVRLLAFDPYKKGAIYIDRWKTINKTEELEIRLPKSPKHLQIVLKPESANSLIKINSIKTKKLNQYSYCFKSSKKIKEFVKFDQNFSENLALLKPGTYYSDNGKFRIDLKPVITDDVSKKALLTPARISNINGRIEVSKEHFLKMTIPMRVAILLHEFSHFNLNKKQKDEIEADLNALKIYLGLGYPYVEAHKSFIHTFKENQSAQNINRYKYIKKFVNNFDRMKYSLCLT